jgi:hypothetical protein
LYLFGSGMRRAFRKLIVGCGLIVGSGMRQAFRNSQYSPSQNESLDGFRYLHFHATLVAGLADGTFHLQLNQAIHFDGIFHGQLFHERLDETVDNHRTGFCFVQSAAHQVEQLFFADA